MGVRRQLEIVRGRRGARFGQGDRAGAGIDREPSVFVAASDAVGKVRSVGITGRDRGNHGSRGGVLHGAEGIGWRAARTDRIGFRKQRRGCSDGNAGVCRDGSSLVRDNGRRAVEQVVAATSAGDVLLGYRVGEAVCAGFAWGERNARCHCAIGERIADSDGIEHRVAGVGDSHREGHLVASGRDAGLGQSVGSDHCTCGLADGKGRGFRDRTGGRTHAGFGRAANGRRFRIGSGGVARNHFCRGLAAAAGVGSRSRAVTGACGSARAGGGSSVSRGFGFTGCGGPVSNRGAVACCSGRAAIAGHPGRRAQCPSAIARSRGGGIERRVRRSAFRRGRAVGTAGGLRRFPGRRIRNGIRSAGAGTGQIHAGNSAGVSRAAIGAEIRARVFAGRGSGVRAVGENIGVLLAGIVGRSFSACRRINARLHLAFAFQRRGCVLQTGQVIEDLSIGDRGGVGSRFVCHGTLPDPLPRDSR